MCELVEEAFTIVLLAEVRGIQSPFLGYMLFP